MIELKYTQNTFRKLAKTKIQKQKNDYVMPLVFLNKPIIQTLYGIISCRGQL